MKELTITGFHNGIDQAWLFDYLVNEEGLELIASEDAPCGLPLAVSRMARVRHCKPSELWHELILEGAESLLPKWKANPETDVEGANWEMELCLDRNESGLEVRCVADSFNSHSWGVKLGEPVVAVLQQGLYIDDADDSLLNITNDLGLDSGDASCLFAAVAAKERGASVEFIDQLERTEAYLRRKVWLIRALVAASKEKNG